MKALITGISGFAGSHLAEFLIEKGYEVFGTFFDKSTFSNLNGFVNKIKVYRCDIRNYDALKNVIEDVKPDEIYHLAAISFIPTSLKDPKLTFDTNLYGTLNLYNAIIELKIGLRVLFVGSADEYGLVKVSGLPIKETCPLRPMNPYAISKASADFLSYFYFRNYNLKIIRVRPFNHVGPKQSSEFVCSDFAKQIAQIEKGLREPIIKVGNLEAKRDFTDVRDMVRGYWLALDKGELGEVYNICSERAIQIKGLLNNLLELSSRKIEIMKDPKRMRPSDNPILQGDSSKFRRRSGWKPEILLDKTLKDILEYWRKVL
ncbi:MAG: GDP-mannose 4,6-dehydratase [Actinomycetia bacterium]|nr:GDP-mannose 4,6-dehydratase [bacterium]MCG2790250.1 GDP-mannose 4,6-dehydratase [Actinomycetes bacterium]